MLSECDGGPCRSVNPPLIISRACCALVLSFSRPVNSTVAWFETSKSSTEWLTALGSFRDQFATPEPNSAVNHKSPGTVVSNQRNRVVNSAREFEANSVQSRVQQVFEKDVFSCNIKGLRRLSWQVWFMPFISCSPRLRMVT